jgi:AcrR family transcriptional regulator
MQPDTTQAILETTGEMLLKKGYGGLCFDAVADAAGVAKQTIYRRWP